MIETALFNEHIKLSAKIVPFAGYSMPVSYTNGINSEYFSIRNEVGMFDVSHMGEFYISGNNANDFLQKITKFEFVIFVMFVIFVIPIIKTITQTTKITEITVFKKLLTVFLYFQLLRPGGEAGYSVRYYLSFLQIMSQ